MATYSKYTNKKGTFWRVRGMIGIDDYTGKKSEINKGGFTSKRQARDYYNKQCADFVSGVDIKSSMRFEEVYEEWLERYKNTVRDSTLITTEEIFYHHILPAFGKMKIKKIAPHQIQRTVNDWCSQYKKGKVFFAYTKRIFNFAVKHGYIKRTPCEMVTVPNKQQFGDDTREKKYYTRDELNQFLDGLKDNPMWYTFFRVLAYTGARRGECLGLTWNDISFIDRTITINKTVAQKAVKIENGKPTHRQLIFDKPKNGKTRIVPIDKVTLNILKRWKTKQAQVLLQHGYNAMSGKQLLFSTLSSNSFIQLTYPRKIAKDNCERVGLPFLHIHGFRHTHATLLLDAGASMKDIQERLGHSNISITMDIYAHLINSRKKETADIFAEYMANN